jgi:hypothetical protein
VCVDPCNPQGARARYTRARASSLDRAISTCAPYHSIFISAVQQCDARFVAAFHRSRQPTRHLFGIQLLSNTNKHGDHHAMEGIAKPRVMTVSCISVVVSQSEILCRANFTFGGCQRRLMRTHTIYLKTHTKQNTAQNCRKRRFVNSDLSSKTSNI